MGNCIFGGLGDEEDLLIKVLKPDGGVLELYSPVTAGSISEDFSGHAIFSALDLLSKPLSPHQHLLPGHSYYLLPTVVSGELKASEGNCHGRSNSDSLQVSLDYNRRVLKRSYTHVLSRNIRQKEKKTRRSKSGIWKVKLVINTEELLKILSEDGKTNELIESMRAAAKGQNVPTGLSETKGLSAIHV